MTYSNTTYLIKPCLAEFEDLEFGIRNITTLHNINEELVARQKWHKKVIDENEIEWEVVEKFTHDYKKFYDEQIEYERNSRIRKYVHKRNPIPYRTHYKFDKPIQKRVLKRCCEKFNCPANRVLNKDGTIKSNSTFKKKKNLDILYEYAQNYNRNQSLKTSTPIVKNSKQEIKNLVEEMNLKKHTFWNGQNIIEFLSDPRHGIEKVITPSQEVLNQVQRELCRISENARLRQKEMRDERGQRLYFPSQTPVAEFQNTDLLKLSEEEEFRRYSPPGMMLDFKESIIKRCREKGISISAFMKDFLEDREMK